MEAMVEAASEHGYADATVSKVIEVAGVSRATFYEQFTDRDDCFLAAYRAKLEAVRNGVRKAGEGRTSRTRPEAILDVLVCGLATDPAVARLILVEALAAPRKIRDEHEELIGRVDGEIAKFLDAQQPAEPLQIPATALLGGVGEVLATRTLTGSEEPLPLLREELARWLDSYRLSESDGPLAQAHWSELGRFAKVIRRDPEDAPALLPRGRSALPAKDAATLRRRRILDATVRLTAEGGYPALTVARIAAAARVPRYAFYSHFGTKEEALLAAQTEGMQGAMALAAAAYSLRAPWPERVWRALVAFLTYAAENPAYARLDCVESYAAGRAVTRHRQQNRMAFALFLEEGYRQSSRAAGRSRFCSEAIGAAVHALMRKFVIQGRTEHLLSLAPAAAYTILAPFLGAEEAAAQVQMWARAAL
jgi:AcrR family transcriptional regulator